MTDNKLTLSIIEDALLLMKKSEVIELYISGKQYNDIIRIEKIAKKYWYLPWKIRSWLFDWGVCK